MTVLKNIFKNILSLFIVLDTILLSKCSSINEEVKKDEFPIKVSIIIPAYNSAEYIERSVGHALNQTLKEIEVIVVDDKSTDNTLEILKKFEKDERLKVVPLSKNQGASVTRNTGMELAQGEFIGFVDSDDYVDYEFFENLYNASKNKDVVIGIFVNSTNDSNKYIHHKKWKSGYGCVGDSIWRRSFLVNNNIKFRHNRKKGEDVDFRKKVYKKKPRIIRTKDHGIYYYYKRREGSLSHYKANFIRKLSNSVKNSK